MKNYIIMGIIIYLKDIKQWFIQNFCKIIWCELVYGYNIIYQLKGNFSQPHKFIKYHSMEAGTLQYFEVIEHFVAVDVWPVLAMYDNQDQRTEGNS